MGRKGLGTHSVVRDEQFCASDGTCDPYIAQAVTVPQTRKCRRGRLRSTRKPYTCATKSMAKKLRYMSKIAAIFARTDKTRLSCTQPIANLRAACLEVFSTLMLTTFNNGKLLSDMAIVLLRY